MITVGFLDRKTISKRRNGLIQILNDLYLYLKENKNKIEKYNYPEKIDLYIGMLSVSLNHMKGQNHIDKGIVKIINDKTITNKLSKIETKINEWNTINKRSLNSLENEFKPITTYNWIKLKEILDNYYQHTNDNKGQKILIELENFFETRGGY